MTKTMLRAAARGAAVLVAAGVLAGTAAAETNLTVWTFLDPAKTSPREVALKQIIENFEAANPDIKVRVEPQDFLQMPTKFYLGHRTGNNPDVVWIDAKSLGGLGQSGAGADLGAAFADAWSDEEKGDFFAQAAWDAGKFDGKLLAVPVFHGGTVVYYRKDLFEAAGLDPASIKSWDDLLAAAKTLTKDNDGDGRIDVWGLGLPLAPQKTESTPVLISLIDELGGDLFDGCAVDLANPTGVKALEYTAGLLTDAKVTPPDAITYTVDDVTEQFAAGRYAIAVTSILRYSVIEKTQQFGAENIGLLRWPSWSGEKPAPTPLAGWWIAVWKDSPNLEAATKFVEYAVSPENATLWVTVGGQVPIRKSIAASGAIDAPEQAWMKAMITAWGESSWMEPSACNTRNLQGVLNEAVARVIFDNADPMVALEEAENKFADAQ